MRFSGPIKLKDLVKQWRAGWHCEDRAGFVCRDLHTETHTHTSTHHQLLSKPPKTTESLAEGEISLIFENMQSQWKRITDEAGGESCSLGESLWGWQGHCRGNLPQVAPTGFRLVRMELDINSGSNGTHRLLLLPGNPREFHLGKAWAFSRC